MDVIDKEKYYSIGRSNNISLRCPILSNCLRRSWTIYIFNIETMKNTYNQSKVDFFKEQGILSEIDEPIELVGEAPSITEGRENHHFNNACPEVLLFDSLYAISYASGRAAISGQWDKFDNPQYKILECRHYSECPEYAKYISNKNILKNMTNTNEKIFIGDISVFGVKLNIMPILKKLNLKK